MDNLSLPLNNFLNQIDKQLIKEINKLTLKQRRQEVQKQLENKNLKLEQLQYLLLLDNTNEELLYRYILALEKKIAILAMQRYSCYMSLQKIKELQKTLLDNKNMGFRNISFKSLFFVFLNAIHDKNKVLIEENVNTIEYIFENSFLNNQPIDLNNFEACYFHFCLNLAIQVKRKKETNNLDEYINIICDYVETISIVLNKFKNEHYEEEKKNIKKFLTIFYSIVNIDKENLVQISQVAIILKDPPDAAKWKQLISIEEERIKARYNKGAELFKKLNLDKNIFCDVSFKYSYNKIEIPEECYLYDYIAENNVFKKYENNLINLFKIIFTSDLFRDLIKLLYKAEDENMKYFFEDEMTVEEFWNNKILFVPFKIKKVSGFSYKDTFNILFSFYKFQYFESNIENEIFTLGAFVRVLIHEILGNIMLAYFYFMFYANFENNKDNFYSPRNKEKIKNLNKSFLYEKIGVSLANSFLNNLLEVKEENALSEKLCNNFEIILGKEYAKRLTQKLLEDKLNIIKIKNEKNLADLSVKIVDILMEFISKDFDNYIKDLDINQNKYKEEEYGNLVEFLLFNNFNQYITLKECLFLLDEEVYKKTNIFKFRFKFNNVFIKNNDEFIKELVECKKIFNDIFYEYNSIYLENKNNNNNDLISPKRFRENFEENLNKKIEPFQCFNLSLDRRILLDKKKSSSKY